jgi:hypothetical protein
MVPAKVDDWWREWSSLLLTALLEVAAVARRARRAGHRDVSAGSVATVDTWLRSGERRVPNGVQSVLKLGLDGSLGPQPCALSRDSATSIIAFYDVLDRRSRAAIIVTSRTALGRLQATPPAVTSGEWFAAHWLASGSGQPHPNPWPHLAALRRHR